MQYSSLIPRLNAIAIEAGQIIMHYYSPNIKVDVKDDNSPVTIADREADYFISEHLKKLTPGISVISEEGEIDISNSADITTYWLVDPLDGTRSFVKGEKEFTVNIGLVINNKPAIGVIFAPALNLLYYTSGNGNSYKCEVADGKMLAPLQITVNKNENDQLRVIASKNYRNRATDDYINKLNVKEFVASSSSYKFCILAEGKADIYPRFGDTMQWDTAAGQAILESAGGYMKKADGSEFTYKISSSDKASFKNPHFIASNVAL